MANLQAFESGFNTGRERADEIHAENKQKKDEEHARTISDLILQRQDLVNKIPTLQQGTPEYDEAHKQLQGVIGDIADVYHPQKNPGAIEKFGHLLTDSLKITNPQDRAKKQSEQHEARTAGNAAATDRAIAAAPLSAAQLNAQKLQATLKEIDASDLDEEGKKAARAKVFGVTTTVKPNWQQFKLPNGTLRSFDLNKPEEIPEGASEVAKGSQTAAKENIANYESEVEKLTKEGKPIPSFTRWLAQERRAGAPSTSASNLYAASYQRAYGIKPEEMTPADWDFIQRKMAFDKAIPQTTTANTLRQNFQEQWVPIQETNTKSPGGPAPMPPRGKPVNNTAPPSREDLKIAETPPPTPAAGATPDGSTPPSPPAASPTPSATPAAPTSSRELKKEADARNPKKTAPAATSSGGGANASVKVGQPIMAAPSKEFRDARATYYGALLRQKQMHNYFRDAEKTGNQQAMLGLLFNHIGMTQGAQKGARINQTSVEEARKSTPWIDSVIAQVAHKDPSGDYIYDGPKGGVTLTDEQMKQMVELADEGVVTFKDNMDAIEKALNEGVTNPSKPKTDANGGGETKKHTIKIGDKRYIYKGTGDTADIKNYTEVKGK